ncbi:Shedu anti-phage system protein SduA domain-containing protein [Longispora sp. NPDC051575]|uniref:Shedu anti-phage system protein SduA domain-containing protein n=1 Tax=Longispora sp. NPDC051575 TaxID=3154943 RepID=UPI00344051B9
MTEVVRARTGSWGANGNGNAMVVRKIRSDYILSAQLRLVDELARSEQVKSAVGDVIRHMGGSRGYRGGRELIGLLEFAARQARAEGEPQVAEMLDDAHGYGTGRILSSEFEYKYQLLGEDEDRNFLQLTMSNIHQAAAAIFDAFLAENPGASTEDARDHFARLGKLTVNVVRERESGFFRVHRLDTGRQVSLAHALVQRMSLGQIADAVPGTAPVSELVDSPDVVALVAAAQLELRKRSLARIRTVVEHPFSDEAQIQKVVGQAPWLFGGSYIGVAARRRLTMGMEVDIPLLRADGSLHLVELKKANIPVVRTHRGRLNVTAAVHEAVGQVMNYLRMLDETRSEVLAEHGVDVSRAGATVVIGHPTGQQGRPRGRGGFSNVQQPPEPDPGDHVL